jgi:hypothetical protein
MARFLLLAAAAVALGVIAKLADLLLSGVHLQMVGKWSRRRLVGSVTALVILAGCLTAAVEVGSVSSPIGGRANPSPPPSSSSRPSEHTQSSPPQPSSEVQHVPIRGDIRSLFITANGEYLLILDDAGIGVWNTRTGERKSSYPDPSIRNMQPSPDGRRVVALTGDPATTPVQIVDLGLGTSWQLPAKLSCAAWNPSSTDRLAICPPKGGGGGLLTFDVSRRRVVAMTLTGLHGGSVHNSVAVPAVAGPRETRPDFEPASISRSNFAALRTAYYSRDGKTFAVEDDGKIHVESMGWSRLADPPGDAWQLSPDGGVIAGSSFDPGSSTTTLTVQDVVTGKSEDSWSVPGSISGLTFSANSQRLLFARDDGLLNSRNLVTHETENAPLSNRLPAGIAGDSRLVAAGPDGRVLVFSCLRSLDCANEPVTVVRYKTPW